MGEAPPRGPVRLGLRCQRIRAHTPSRAHITAPGVQSGVPAPRVYVRDCTPCGEEPHVVQLVKAPSTEGEPWRHLAC